MTTAAASGSTGSPLRAGPDWFVTREIERGVWLVAEPPHVNSWLVAGNDRAVLLDTGLGVRSMRQAIESLTRLPVVVVNTHSHFDHVGSNHEFDEILIHPLGAPLLEREVDAALLDGYLGYVDALEAALPAYLAADERFFFHLEPDAFPRPFPREGRWRIPASRASGLVEDGSRIDLGGRTLTALATPGHSPDHLSFVLEGEGALFAGDAISTGAIYAQWPESDVEEFARTTERLAALAPELRVVYVHHFQRFAAPPSFLADVATGFRALVGGNASRTRAAVDCAGQQVTETLFDRFSIFTRQGVRP